LSKVVVNMTTIERIASWVSSLRVEDVPGRIIELLRAQRMSVFGALGASAGDEATRRVLKGLGAFPEPFRRDAPESAIYAGAVMSVALDFDDYLCFGHTGHTSVLVPAFLAPETKSSGTEQLVAQLAANEIGGRLGGACLIGPLNGQLWSFIHSAEAAVAAGRLLGLEEKEMAHALAISLYQPPRPSVPGFMAPDSKLLTAAEPAMVGLRAARLAAAGVTGPLDVLDHPHGFFRTFSYAPIRGMLEGLGNGWATDTLCVKRYPGCAYVDPVIDAVLHLGPPKVDEVERVRVRAGALTCGMDALSAEYAAGETLTPVTINFSVGANVAIAIIGSRLTTEELRSFWIENHASEIARLRRRVELAHDWELTRKGSRGFSKIVPTKALLREPGPRRLGRGLRKMRRDHRGVALRLGDSLDLLRWFREQRSGSGDSPSRFWEALALRDFRMILPATVEVELRSGETIRAAIEIPAGAAGHRSLPPVEVAKEKFARWGPELWASRFDVVRQAVADDADDLAARLTTAAITG
jgi:2-methylcitrate dehydratase PrpD